VVFLSSEKSDLELSKHIFQKMEIFSFCSLLMLVLHQTVILVNSSVKIRSITIKLAEQPSELLQLSNKILLKLVISRLFK
jgi:hypothetical protein